MPLKHAFTCAIADDSADAAAGKVVPSNWNADHTVLNGVDFPAESPAQPSADNMRLYGKKLASRMMAGFKSSLEVDQLLQTYVGDGQTSLWLANNGTTSLTTIAASTPTTAGTATNGNIALTSKVQSINAVEFLVTTASTTAVASFRYTATQWVRGNTVGGGFFFHMRCAPATGASNTSMRYFMGMRQATAAPTDVEPSTTVHCIGFGWDSADANCQIFTNDGTGTATKTDLGASWAVPVTDRAAMYDLFIFAPPNNSNVYVTVIDLADGKTYSNSFSADIPPQTTYLTPTSYASVGGVSSVVGIRFASCFIEALT